MFNCTNWMFLCVNTIWLAIRLYVSLIMYYRFFLIFIYSILIVFLTKQNKFFFISIYSFAVEKLYAKLRREKKRHVDCITVSQTYLWRERCPITHCTSHDISRYRAASFNWCQMINLRRRTYHCNWTYSWTCQRLCTLFTYKYTNR